VPKDRSLISLSALDMAQRPRHKARTARPIDNHMEREPDGDEEDDGDNEILQAAVEFGRLGGSLLFGGRSKGGNASATRTCAGNSAENRKISSQPAAHRKPPKGERYVRRPTSSARCARMQLYRARNSRVASAFTTGYAAITVRSVTSVPSAGIVPEEAVLFVGQTIISETPIH
jgi:hypothetical protein